MGDASSTEKSRRTAVECDQESFEWCRALHRRFCIQPERRREGYQPGREECEDASRLPTLRMLNRSSFPINSPTVWSRNGSSSFLTVYCKREKIDFDLGQSARHIGHVKRTVKCILHSSTILHYFC